MIYCEDCDFVFFSSFFVFNFVNDMGTAKLNHGKDKGTMAGRKDDLYDRIL